VLDVMTAADRSITSGETIDLLPASDSQRFGR
jgi:hypothetical protein